MSVAAQRISTPSRGFSPPVAMVTVDLGGTVLSWNAAAESLYAISAEDAVGRPARDLIVPTDNRMVPAVVMAEVRVGRVWEGEYRVRRRDGRELTLHVVNSPLYDESGTLAGVLGTAVDVTKERLASLAVLEAVVTNTATSVTIVGPDDSILLTMGDSRTDSNAKSTYVGRNIAELIPDPSYRRLIARVRAGDSARQVVVFGGRTYDSSMVQLPDMVAGPGAVAVVATDITERVAESRRFQALIEKSQEVTSIVESDGSLRYISPAIEALCGYTPAEIMAMPSWDFVHPDDLAASRVAFQTVMRAPGAVVNQVYRGRHRDGTWRVVEQTMVNHTDDPAVAGVVTVARDATARLAAERRLLSLNRIHSVLSEVGNALVRAHDPMELLGEVCRILVETGECAGAAFTTEPSHPHGVLLLAQCHADCAAESVTTAAIAAAVVASTVAEPTPGLARRVVPAVDASPGGEILLLGVARREDLDGVLGLHFTRASGAVSTEEIELLGGLARDIALTLDALSVERTRAEALELSIRRARQQSIVSALGLMALGVADTGGVIDAAVAALAEFGLRQITVYERIDGADDLLVRAVAGQETPVRAGDRIDRQSVPMSDGVLVSGEAGTVSDFGVDPRFNLDESPFAPVGSAVSVPIRAAGIPVAVLTVHSFRQNDFDPQDVHFYEAIANVISGAIERSRYEDGIRHDAMHDRVTGLTNRSLLQDRLAQALRRRQRHQSGPLAVLAADIDGFKKVNASLGHEAGDRLLALVGGRLAETVRPSDTVARLGGDEFVVLCENLTDPSEAATVAVRIVEAMRREFHVDGKSINITMSIGIAASADEATVGGLLRDADVAMYRAKERGRDRYETVDDALRSRLADRVEMEQALRQALADHEFRVAYQPKISLLTNRMVGVEALLRWDHQGRVIPPLEFIPLAEETGLIVPIGAWVLSQVCRDAKKWERSLPGGLPMTVAVNVSPRQFQPGLAAAFGQIIRDASIDPVTVCLEVTESMVMQDPDLAVATLRELKLLGLQVSIDDFGTGLSSLAYLRRFPVDELKIDKSFVDGLGQDPEDTAIVAAVMGMAHALDLRVVAEGVETAEQLERLRTLGCDTAQGYFLGRPGSVADIETLIQTDAEAATSGAEPVGTAGSAQRVLVVDDAADVRQLARASLTAVGFEVAEASSGESALLLISEFRPDCVVLDVNLPGITGFDVCRMLREKAPSAPLTIVMMSGNADPAEKVEAFSLRVDDYMVKPFSPRDIVSRVTAAMRRQQTARRSNVMNISSPEPAAVSAGRSVST